MTSNQHRNVFAKHGIDLKLRRPGLIAAGMSAALAAGVVGGGVANAATSAHSTTTAPAHSMLVPRASLPNGAKAPAGKPSSINLPGNAKPAVVGTVKSVGDDSFTVLTRSGTVTVDVSSSTTYLNGSSSAGYASVTSGRQVAVAGTASDGVVTATKVLIGTPPSANGKTPAATPTAARAGTKAPSATGAPAGAPRAPVTAS
jgi:Domain of unknown function (DUF5666)